MNIFRQNESFEGVADYRCIYLFIYSFIYSHFYLFTYLYIFFVGMHRLKNHGKLFGAIVSLRRVWLPSLLYSINFCVLKRESFVTNLRLPPPAATRA